METVAICSPNIKKLYPKSKIQEFSFCDIDIPVGILPIETYNYDFRTNNDVLIEVKSFSCNFRDRALLIDFNSKCRLLSTQGRVMYSPFGSDFVAVIKKIAPNVKSLKIGDRVIPNCHYYDLTGVSKGIPTNYASQRILVFHEEMLVKIPDSMPDEVAASFSIASQTIYSMVRKTSIKQGENVLVTAPTSNTSLAAIKALKNKGCKIFATSSNHKNEEFLLSWGVDQFIPAETLRRDGSNKIFFDVVIDPYYDLYLNGVINHINFNGRYIFCGYYAQYTTIEKSKQLFEEDYKGIFLKCMIKNISVIGNCLGTTNDLENAVKDYSEDKYNILIDSVYSGVDVILFLERSYKDPSRIGKVVYSYTD